MAKTIKFKSTPENWLKEFLGLKRNTVRIRSPEDEGDIRFEILDDFISGKWHTINVEIEKNPGYEVFTRPVTDVTKYCDIYIISW